MDDKKIIRECKTLAKNACANYDQGMCLTDDCPCYVVNTKYPTIHDGAIDCDYFIDAVLRGEPELFKLVMNGIYGSEETGTQPPRNCILCGTPYVPSSPRQKYCRSCGEIMAKQRNRDKQRRFTERKRKAGMEPEKKGIRSP